MFRLYQQTIKLWCGFKGSSRSEFILSQNRCGFLIQLYVEWKALVAGTWKTVDANPRRFIINHPPCFRKHTFNSCYLELLNMQLDRAFESLID